jgi:histidine ammonia-lyase
MLVDLLNHRITPVVQSRGTLGEGDLAQLSNVGATMVGAGDAYYQGARMTAADALAKAGLKPIQPFAADTNALTSSDAYGTGIASLVVDDARQALEWADVIYAMDLNAMNSSITPISTVVQRERPFKWLNWEAARVRDMIKGSYLFSDDPRRIIQDPESLRASSIRQASAWEDWGALRDAVVLQMNSSDHNPAVRTDLSPQDSWAARTATASMAISCRTRTGIPFRWRTSSKTLSSRWQTWTSPCRCESIDSAIRSSRRPIRRRRCACRRAAIS